jgi:cyclic beta-1,2-glucan glucanotransferase
MATTHHSSFDFRINVPLPGRPKTSSSQPDTTWSETNGPERTEERWPLAGAIREVLTWKAVETGDSCNALMARMRIVSERIHGAVRELQELSAIGVVPQGDAKTISDNLSTMKLALLESKAGIQASHDLPHVEKAPGQSPVPRPFTLATSYLQSSGFRFEEQSLVDFVIAVQEKVSITMSEIWNLKPFLEYVLLETIGDEISGTLLSDRNLAAAPRSTERVNSNLLSRLVNSLQQICDLDWKTFFEAASETERTLRMDPLGAYEKMDWESREMYRAAVTDFAAHSKWTESQVARKAMALALMAQRGASSERERRAHVGYYLVDAGRTALEREVVYRSSLTRGLREAILKRSDFFYLIGIEVISLGVITLLLSLLHVTTYGILALTFFLLPAVGCAVTTMNMLATRLFPPRKLPKLDFSKGIPDDCATVVVVPALLTSEEQVRLAVQGLETRFLANRDANLHFSLLTDPPDSTQQTDERDALAHLCLDLIRQLNAKYAPQKKGTFFHFHRHPTYNPSEGLWMGWERKRGKLLEFNRFLLNRGDSFPVKTGDLSLLTKGIRYVITLDLDTQLPPGTAHRLVGALAHPLNRAVIDPVSNTVVEGYGILQPRVDISIRSASRSRFASLLSGDTGFDVYTRAVSDVYQDLFGEGIFTGKGIYEVRTFQKILEHRFPCNAILSHDLIEGVYARTGLVSDVEVVDDYPSHYSAFSRRRHRWVRGDWQIMFGLLPRVRNSLGRLVRNPLSHISRWKIIDNLRRSLMDCATVLLLLYGWLCGSSDAAYWTLAALAILLFPTYVQFALAMLTAGRAWFTASFWKNACSDFAYSHTRIFLRLTLLLHQSLIDADAVVRTLVRMKFTHRRLLEWQTAADVESDVGGKSLVDLYLKCTLPLSVTIGTLVLLNHPRTLMIALPFLLLWGFSSWICRWLSRPQRPLASRVSHEDCAGLRHVALRTWRFFREFSNEEENWLVPDIVQETPPLVAHRISPTNLGLLLNSRLAALDLGFLTLSEFIADTEKTFETVSRMPKCRGHLYNWYATDTLQPIQPLFVSSVDSGNLLCSLWTLEQGCLEVIKQPLVRTALWEGISDHVELLVDLVTHSIGDREVISAVHDLRRHAAQLSPSAPDRYDHLRAFESDVTVFLCRMSECEGMEEARWWARELSQRVTNLRKMLELIAPWLVGQFAGQCSLPEFEDGQFVDKLTLESLPHLYGEMCKKLRAASEGTGGTIQTCSEKNLLDLALKRAIRVSQDIVSRLTALAASAQSMAEGMDFGFLYDPKKKLLSIGYDGGEGSISAYHYDLLASEARAAVFGAIAKGEIPLDSWFQLKRSYRSYKREDVLLSWTGTAFEYLMPCLWIRPYPNTLIERSARTAIRAQQKFAREKAIPWGISESSCNERNPDGLYRYHAFGVPGLAVHRDDCSGDLVIAPYATFLGLLFDTPGAVKNLRKMKKLGWLSPYGFYEAADFTARRVSMGRSHDVVRNWMAHHQAMSLVAVANVLCDSAMQRRFHSEPRVAAAERLLHEKYPRVLPRQHDPGEIPEPDSALVCFTHQTTLHPGFRSLSPKLS